MEKDSHEDDKQEGMVDVNVQHKEEASFLKLITNKAVENAYCNDLTGSKNSGQKKSRNRSMK